MTRVATVRGRAGGLRAAAAAAILLAASLALFWPGFAMYDTLAQFGQVLDGRYVDWHPPAMARLWAALGGADVGAWPMLAVQLTLYWAGLGALAAASGGRTAVAILVVGLFPPFLGWQGVVLKDAQLTGALLAASGLVGFWRLRGCPVPWPAAVGAALLIGYAILVRANAAFAGVPLAVLLAPRPRGGMARVVAIRAGVVAVGTAAVLALLGPINHGVMAARASGVERTQAIYDLAGIAVRLPPGTGHTGLLPAERDELVARRCVRPYFWDPLGEPSRCDATVERLRRGSVGALYATLADAVVHHPIAYAAHRLAHLNSTTRWWVPARWPGAAPPQLSERNDDGLGTPGRAATRWQVVAGRLVEWPLAWPAVWVAVAIVGVAVAAQRPAAPRRDVAAALFGSALCLEASFAVLSIASDLRYHLWPMIATALAAALLADRRPSRRAMLAGGALLALVVGVGIVARAVLPPPPQSYVGMLG